MTLRPGRLRALLLLAALVVALPAAAQVGARVPASPLYDAIRDAGASPTDAASLAAVFTQETVLTASDAAASDFFGPVSVSGDRAMIGALNKNNSTGAVYVFVRTGTTWTQEAKLVAPDGVPGDRFGNAISLDGDRAAIGAFYDDGAAGSTYVFLRDGATWTQEAKLVGQFRGGDYFFGVDVSLSGDRLLVSASAERVNGQQAVGTAYVFARQGSTWTQEARLVSPTPSAVDRFGTVGRLSGDRALIGERADDNANGTDAGAAYVFVRDGTTWTLEAKLIATGGGSGDLFGTAAAFDGDRAIIGAANEDNANGTDAGAAYTFTRSGSTWTQEAQLLPTGGAAGDAFGSSVALLGERALVGALGRDTAGNVNAGAAYTFVLADGTWTQEAELTRPDGAANDEFGGMVALTADRLYVGAIGDEAYTGSMTVYRIPPVVTGAFAFLRPTASDSYRVGGFFKAIWDSPAPAPATVVLSLRKGTGPYTEIYRGPNLARPDFVAARYLIPDGTPAGTDYTLRIEDAADATSFAVSDAFSITDRARFVIQSPAEGQTLALGGSHPVRWTTPAGAAGGTVTLTLYRQDGTPVTGLTTENTGEATFSFPTGSVGGYYLTIESDQNAAYTGRSSAFRLAVLGVSSPFTGDVYDEGDALTVRFDAPTLNDPSAAVQVQLRRTGAPTVVLAASTANDGEFATTIPAGLPTASNYYVLVRLTSGGVTYKTKSPTFAINGTASPRLAEATPTHFALSPLTYGSREATVAVSGLADGAEVGAFWNDRLVGAGVVRSGVATFTVSGALVVASLVDGAVTADDVVPVPDGAALALRIFDGTERALDVSAPLAFADGGETVVAARGTSATTASPALTVSAWPNPTSGASTVRFATAIASDVTVAVYDVLGRRVAVLADGAVEAGTHEARWDARAAAPGVYVVRVSTGTTQATTRVTVAR